MVLDLTMSMAILALMGALATIAGCLEDLESDVGSQSNPNSQVQLAPQMGFLHRIYNKAISGEPISNGLSAVYRRYGYNGASERKVLSIDCNSNWRICRSDHIGHLCHNLICRESCEPDKVQAAPVYGYYEVHNPFDHSDNFIVNFCLVAIAYIQYEVLGYPFTIPFLALIWGISVGAIGSSVGDVHYGGEREFQTVNSECGLNTALSGRIVRKAESGLRNSIDNVWFCAKSEDLQQASVLV